MLEGLKKLNSNNGVEFGVGCALIIGQRKESTDLKTSLNDALRDFNVSILIAKSQAVVPADELLIPQSGKHLTLLLSLSTVSFLR